MRRRIVDIPRLRFHRPTARLLALGALCLPSASVRAEPLAGPHPGNRIPAQDTSLEQALRSMRRAADERLGPLRGEVERGVRELERLARASESKLAPVRARLLGLGPPAAPLLVPWLDPGQGEEEEPASDAAEVDEAATPAPTEAKAPVRGTPAPVARARQVARVLRELAAPAVTDRLLALARDGSIEARCNALTALGRSPEAERVQPVLRKIYAGSSGRVRRHALDALSTLGGPRGVFLEALRQEDDDLAEVALTALAAQPNAASTTAVISFLEGPAGPRHVAAIRDYLARAAEYLDDTAVEALIETLASPNLVPRDKADLLDTLAQFDLHLDSALRRSLEPLTESSADEVAEAALILLARHKDGRAKRRLLEPYDKAVDRSKGRPNVYSRRAYVLYKVRDLRSAIRDYKRALELGRGSAVDEVPLLGLARCYALQGRFKDAAEYLERAPVSVATLHVLATEPDFAEMVQDKVGREVFRLPEEDDADAQSGGDSRRGSRDR